MKVLLFAVVFVFTSQASDPVPVTCEYEGEQVPVGGTRGDPCNECTCTDSGQMACLVVDCIPTPCVNTEYTEGQCCGTCPDGPNCRHPKRRNRTLKVGESVRKRSKTCTCVLDGFSTKIVCI